MNKCQTICWNCKNTNGNKCSWFAKNAKPVDGWVAIRNDMVLEKRVVPSYCVLECPNFVEEEIKTSCEYINDSRCESEPMDKREKMGVALKKCMDAHGISAKALASEIEKCADSVHRYIRGYTSYSPKMVAGVLPDIYDYIKAEG